MQSAHTDRISYLLIALALLSLPSLSALARAQTQAAPLLSPLFANLTLPLDISHTKIGTHVQARIISPWIGNGCNLRVGDLVEGHVSQVERRSKTDQKSAIHLVFDTAECNRHRGTPLKALLIALLGPPESPPGMGKSPPLTDVPLTIAGGLRSVETASDVNRNFIVDYIVPTEWKPGMVFDVPMKLTVGRGAEGGSIVWTTNNDARLEAHTTLIMIATSPTPSQTSTPPTTP